MIRPGTAAAFGAAATAGLCASLSGAEFRVGDEVDNGAFDCSLVAG